jgi:hypothetical protein
MKKFALFAMLLGSTFLFGCTETKKEPVKPKDGDKPAVDKPADKDATPPAKPEGDKPADKDATPPAEPAK